MKLRTRVKNAYSAFTKTKVNNDSSGASLAADYLRYGSQNKPMLQDWSQVEMSDQDMYTGYSYAAINRRANRTAILGKNFLYTKATDQLMEAAKAKDTALEHPYLPLISGSKDFSENDFWKEISIYLDLEGVYYLMAVRAVGQNADETPKVGAIQKFVLLNPYEVRRVFKGSSNELGGYVEAHDGMYREIPKEMIIEMRSLNPFKKDIPFSMTDAAKESQFTLKQAGDYARHSIRGNINAPGAITTDVVLEDHIFDNFVSRIQNHTKGEPLYGNGAGAINWSAMQIDLDKAALDKINEIHRSVLFAVSGTSKTAMGIEESGTTRDVSKTQKDNFTEDAIMPQVEKIIDCLNLDYRRYYPEWDKTKYEICLDNPLESDRAAELKDIEIRTKEFEMRDVLLSQGYEYEIAAKYAHGDIGILELGEPTLEPEMTDEEADAIVAKEMGLELPQETAPQDPSQQPQLQQQGAQNRFLAENKKGYNPYRDSIGQFDDGPTKAERSGRKMVDKGANEKKLEAARKRAKDAQKKKKQDEKAAKDAEKAKTTAKDGGDYLELKGAKAAKFAATQEVDVSDKEKEAIDAYKSIYYEHMNTFARKGEQVYNELYKGKRSALTKKEVETYTKTLDAAIAKNTVQKDMYTYRLVASDKIKSVDDKRLLSDKAFMSTTVASDNMPTIIDNLYGDSKKYYYVIKAKVPKGTKGLFVDSAIGGDSNEAELILPRNTKLQVNGTTSGKIKLLSTGGDINVTFIDAGVVQ